MTYNFDGFYPANVAREISVGNRAGSAVILAEINAVQVAIDNAAGASQMRVVVSDSTIMTSYDNYDGVNTSSYYDAWEDSSQYNDSVHIVAREKMNQVISYFTRLGYSIGRERNATLNQIQWVIKW